MGAAGRGDGDVETRRRFAAPPKFRIFFPLREKLLLLWFSFSGLSLGFCIFFLSRYYFFFLLSLMVMETRKGRVVDSG